MRALVLSGGGAKGSFELGALQYLYRYNFGPEIICSTSVGSINGLKLTEGEGDPDQGFQGLESIWLGMQTNTDMYDEEGWLKGSADWIKQVIAGSDVSLMGLPAFLEGAILVFIPGVGADYLDDLKKFGENLKHNKSLFHLEPIRLIAYSNIDLQKVASSGIRLRMAVVGLESGRLKYVTERGRLVERATQASDDPYASQVDVIDGMLGSAAIPAIFRPQKLAGEWFVDGGVREVAPVAAAVDMGATHVVAVVAPIRLQQDDSYDGKGALDVAGRAIDAMSDEVIVDDVAQRGGWGVPVFPVRPVVEVEPSRTIDPGLIRINADYGYMRTFDTLEQLSSPLRASLTALSDAIAALRRQVWDTELNVWETLSVIGAGDGTPATVKVLAALFDSVRGLKRRVRGMAECRLAVGGLESIHHVPTEWWMQWEQHGPGWETFAPDSPWDELSFRAVHRDLGGTTSYVYDVFIPAATPDPIPYDDCPRLAYRSSAPSGAYIQTVAGRASSFEIAVVRKAQIEHYSRDVDSPHAPWFLAERLPVPAGAGGSTGGGRIGVPYAPSSVAVWQAYPSGNLEALVHFRTVVGSGDYLGHYLRDAGGWHGPRPITVGGRSLDGVTAAPALIQGNWGNVGNYEMVIARNGKLEHHARSNDAPGLPWHLIAELPLPASGSSGGISGVAVYPASLALIQTSVPHTFIPNGDLELIVLFKPVLGDIRGAYLAGYRRDATTGTWAGPAPLKVGGALIDGVEGRPAVIQSAAGTYDLQMLAIRGGKLEHYARAVDRPDADWRKVAEVFSGGAQGRVITTAMPASVALFQSFPGKDLQALVLFSSLGGTGAGGSDYLATYVFSEDEQVWKGPFTIQVGGAAVEGADPF